MFRLSSMGHFFSDIWFLKNHPNTCPSSWLPEKTPGCQKKYCVLRETGQMPIFFYWFRCIIRFWNSLLSSNNPLLEKVVQADLLIANRSAIHGLIRFCTHSKISLHLSNFWMPYDVEKLSILNSSSSLCANVSSGAGENLMIWHHMMITFPAELWGLITHNLVYLWGLLLAGWWDDRKRNHKPVLPIYLRLDTSNKLSRALSCLRLSGHNFLVQRMRHDRNRRSCSWAQDMWQMWLALCSGWGTHFAGLSAWTPCIPSHKAPPASFPTSIWRKRKTTQAVKTTPHMKLRKVSHFGTEYRKTPLPADKKGPVKEVQLKV